METENTNNIQSEQNQQTEQEQPMTMSEKLVALRQEWTNTVHQLNNDMKTINSLDHLLNTVYKTRQDAVDMYYATYNVYAKQTNAYKKKYAEIYNSFKLGTNGIRYTNESSIQVQCESALIDQKNINDELKSFIDFMWETVRTIDGIQYAISHKIKIYEIMNGLKF